MVNEYFDCELVKERFALLLSKLHETGLPAEYISQVIVESSFFDCFEKNDLTAFLSSSLESITSNVFRKEVIYDYSSKPGDPYYWAGLIIMSVMMNLRTPLKRILLIMPLPEIVSCFALYHEMNDEQFLEHFVSIEKERSLLKIIRKDKRLSLSKISFLTGIKVSTLERMDASTEALLSSSFSSLSLLADLFSLSTDVFKKVSSYVPYSDSILRSEKMETLLGKNLCIYFNIPAEKGFSITREYVENKEIRRLLQGKKALVDLSDPFGIAYLSCGCVKRKILSKEEFLLLYQKSVQELKAQENGLLF